MADDGYRLDDHLAEWLEGNAADCQAAGGCTHGQGVTGAPDIKILQGSVITIELPGLTAIRIDTATRTIAVDGISGGTSGEPCLPDWFVADLRDGIYGDFHRLRPSHECNDPGTCDPSQHNALYPHYHEGVEDFTACQPCIDRAGDLHELSHRAP